MKDLNLELGHYNMVCFNLSDHITNCLHLSLWATKLWYLYFELIFERIALDTYVGIIADGEASELIRKRRLNSRSDDEIEENIESRLPYRRGWPILAPLLPKTYCYHRLIANETFEEIQFRKEFHQSHDLV